MDQFKLELWWWVLLRCSLQIRWLQANTKDSKQKWSCVMNDKTWHVTTKLQETAFCSPKLKARAPFSSPWNLILMMLCLKVRLMWFITCNYGAICRCRWYFIIEKWNKPVRERGTGKTGAKQSLVLTRVTPNSDDESPFSIAPSARYWFFKITGRDLNGWMDEQTNDWRHQ